MRTAWYRWGPVLATLSILLTGVSASGRAQQVAWEKINPAFAGAKFVNDDKSCATCHDAVAHKFDGSAHAEYFKAGKTAVAGTCESCHGPRSKHVDDSKPVAEWKSLTKAQQSGICMQCHAGGSRLTYMTGAHAAGELSCTSCHAAKAPRGGGAVLARARATESCYRCHASTKAQMAKTSHHPVREGRMDCVSCHNVHGSNPALLKHATLNETCNSCHTEKRGPFLWEHAPVRESCANCHSAHGSTNRKLLNKKDAFLCLQCHSYGGHINLPRYNRTSNPYGEGCVNCHMTIHGSQHPSGPKFTR
ncbi:MAG: DmsE family decaheme c-type cytochrome [Gemmatimonadetes bacterium]|nr:DmsE family decaheme c-type cytochrome [Gemmatimonadota bacterium]